MSNDYTVWVNVEGDYLVDDEAIWAAAWCALDIAQAPKPLSLSIIITTAERVHALNKEFAGIDSTTDVLSFPAEDGPYAVEPGEPPYQGDVLIAYPVAEQQADERGHDVLNELQILAIHGVLHLVGYDHDTPDNKAMMWALESAAMDSLRNFGHA